MDSLSDTLATIEEGRERYARLADADENVFLSSYAPGKWTGVEILAHVADSDMACYIRVIQAVAEESDELAEMKLDGERLARELRYHERPAAVSLGVIQGTRTALLHVLRTTPEEVLRRELTHPTMGKVTPLFYAKIPAEHGMHHLEQLEAIRNGKPVGE